MTNGDDTSTVIAFVLPAWASIVAADNTLPLWGLTLAVLAREGDGANYREKNYKGGILWIGSGRHATEPN